MGRKKKDFHDKKKKDFLQDCANASNMEMFKYVYLNNEKTNFMISSKGRIFSLNFNKSGEIKELKTTLNKDGHKQITLKFKGKNYSRRIHRLVAEAFIPNPNCLPQVNHIDEDKSNNRCDNLEWCDSKYNCNYGSRNKKGSENRLNIDHTPKRVICLETKEIYDSMAQASKEIYNTDNANGISRCINKPNKAYKGYHWMYYNEYLEIVS